MREATTARPISRGAKPAEARPARRPSRATRAAKPPVSAAAVSSEALALDALRGAIAEPTGVTLARGFHASGVHCGIRRKKLDLALIVSDRPASAACVFTTNLAQAAPILVSREHMALSHGLVRAIVVNAGNANACTGEPGLAAARATAAAAAGLLTSSPEQILPEQILVASTGVIGQPLPIARILEGLPESVAGLSRSGGTAASEAILTTDLCPKIASRTVTTARGSYTIGGMAKGSGMIHPNMATTLAFVTTDAAIDPASLHKALRRAADRSFNRISVDGDTSTNDMIAVLANGASGVRASGPRFGQFEAALTEVLTELALMVVRDGEGATRLIAVEVTGARSEKDALQVARTIAGSPLVKTAVHGADANWGRIIAAACRAGVPVDPAAITIALGDEVVLRPGYVSDFSEPRAKQALEQPEVAVRIDLGAGCARATVWTCDLSAGYVAINAGYRS